MKSASKIGSSTSFRQAWTTRSRAVAIPSMRVLPPALGISTSRTGMGLNVRALSSARSPVSNLAGEATERGATPSTPAVRPPLFALTRSHETTRKAGSTTRLKRSSNWQPGSSVAHWCSLVWILSTRASASSRLGHGSSVFTNGLLTWRSLAARLAAPLCHVDGFPVLGLLRGLRPIRP